MQKQAVPRPAIKQLTGLEDCFCEQVFLLNHIGFHQHVITYSVSENSIAWGNLTKLTGFHARKGSASLEKRYIQTEALLYQNGLCLPNRHKHCICKYIFI